jgi:DNA mismatch repair protein MutS
MYRKYYEVWSAHSAKYGPRTALLYQVGGFFEIYDTENLATGTTQANIREIAELCQLSLTVHPVEGSTDVQTLFGGFPEHSIGKFERILVHAGFTVVVVVQKKNSTGAVEERVVGHISSPGCYVDGAKERRLVGCVFESLMDGPAALRHVYWAVAALDVATGRIWFAEGADRDRLHQFLCMHPPAEMVIWSDGAPAAVALSGQLSEACSATHIRCLAPASVAVEMAALDKHWAPATKRLDWISRLPQARRCLAALMDFAAEHMPSSLVALAVPEAWVPTGEVRLGNAALEQLGLLSLRSENKQSLLCMLDQCRSIAGRRMMRSRLMRPISDVAELRSRQDRIRRTGKAMEVSATAALTERSLRSLYDLTRLFRRLELGSATITDMSCLLRAYDAALSLLETWAGDTGSDMQLYLGWISARWNTNTAVEMAREGRSVPVTVLPWIAGTRPAVETVFAEGSRIRERAVALCRAWSALGRGEQLYLDDAEGGGFRITGTKRRISSVLTSLRDGGDTTAVVVNYKSTASLEAAALEVLTKEHRAWYQKWLGVWAEAWTASLAEIVTKGREIHGQLTEWCGDLDVSWTVARLAKEWLWKEPIYIDGASEASVEVTRLRHPILERIVTVPYVAHSVRLGKATASATATAVVSTDASAGATMTSTAVVSTDASAGATMTASATASSEDADELTHTNRGLLLYGMNASGKSSLMKALGLAVLLAQCGFPVPAASMRLAPFTAIFTRILGNDNLWAGLSSFAVEMTEFREILRYADERSLVLGDELCSGTESLSATALVAAGVETLAGRGTKFVFATHLHELATLPDIVGLSGVRAVHLRVHYDSVADRLVYDRHLAAGAGSALYGLEVCRALDLPLGYLDRATALRKTLAGWQAPHTSSYSTGAVVSACAICSAAGTAARLEMHHIRPQADAVVAAAEGTNIHAPGNLVCLCAKCHDDHHAGVLVITRWEETSAGRRLVWSRSATETDAIEHADEVTAWIREQRHLKIRIPTIQRVAKQIFGVELTAKEIRAVS